MFKMKTSKILLAMALPVAFAACSSEEIVENNNVSLQNRELLPAMAAVVESGVDSRFSWNEETFGWNKFTAEDNFAAGLTDATLWDVQNLMMTNYIFNDEAGNGSYTTTSQMVEGTYFFYSYPGFENVAARQGVPFDLTSQKSVDFKKPADAVEENQLFVSALYKLDKATANEALPIKFVSYWSTAGMKIKNTTGDDMKIVRMLITADKDMEFKGIVAPANLGDAAKKNSDISGLVYYNNGTSYVLPFDATAEDNVEWNDIKTIDMADSSVEGGLAEKTMMLTVENGELADDEEATVYFQMPAGEYGKVTVTFFVEVPTADGETEVKELEAVEFAKNAMASEDSEENDITAFYRGGTTSAFGVLAGELAAHKITELDVLSATESGAYAASYEDLVDIIKAGNETVISNMGDLKIDDAVIALFKSTTAKNNLDAGEYYVFNNPIEITTEKTTAQTLKNIQVKDAEIVKGKFVAAYDLGGNVTVNQNTELQITASQTGTITNIGTVKVENATEIVTVNIEDGATEENEAETTVELALASAATAIGASEYPYTVNNVVMSELPTNLKLNAPKVSGEAVAATYALHEMPIAYGKNVYVGEKVTLKTTGLSSTYSTVTVNGYVKNEGKMEATTIYGSWNSTSTAAEGASIDNYGEITSVAIGSALSGATEAVETAVKDAVIITNEVETAKIGSASLVSGANLLGKIDNNAGGFVTTTSSDVEVYANVTEDTTGKINISDINTLYLNGMTWTQGTVSSNISKIYMNNVTLVEPTTDGVPSAFDDTTAAKIVEFKAGTANCQITIPTTAIIDGSVFNYNLNYNGTDLLGVTVKGIFTTTPAAAMNWTGVTLNKITVNGTPSLNVKAQANKNASGTITSYTVKTTILNDVITGAFNAVVVENDAILTIKNDVELNAATITVNGKSAVSGSVNGVLNVYGTTTVTPSGEGTIRTND